MWIIRFEHDKGAFQSEQSLLYELNLRSLPLDQAQDVTKVGIPLYKNISLSGIKYIVDPSFCPLSAYLD